MAAVFYLIAWNLCCAIYFMNLSVKGSEQFYENANGKAPAFRVFSKSGSLFILWAGFGHIKKPYGVNKPVSGMQQWKDVPA
nr:hypothetical protein [uncultured Oscillibacter sp.]